MARAKTRVLVVEDDEAIRESLAIALRREGFDVRVESDGLRLQTLVEHFHPDLVLLDVRLPQGPDGYGIARTLRCSRNVPILFLSAADDLNARLTGFESGGDDYLGKPFELAEVIARSRALLRRAGGSSGRIRIGDLLVDEGTRIAMRSGTKLNLTRTELELLTVFAQHPGQVLSKPQLLLRVWGSESFDINRVEVHVSSLRRKLDSTGPPILHNVRGVGFVLRVEPS